MVLNAGRVEQVGTPLEVYDRPATTFVAGFIGSPAMNFLPAAISPDGRHVAIDQGPSLPLPLDFSTGEPGRRVTLGIRPEHIEAGTEGAATEAVAHFTMKVDLSETLGADTLVYGLVSAGGPTVTVRTPGNRRFRGGEAVPLHVSLDHIHLFDPLTRQRLTA